MKNDIPNKETVWFYEDACKACTEGLNQRMRELIESGLSQRKASEVMEKECNGELSANNIRKRFAYYNRPKSTPTKTTKSNTSSNSVTNTLSS